MKENLTIPQLLERLAVVAQGMVVVHTNKYGMLYELPYSDERFSDRDFKKNEVQWLLFGAACEKIESLGLYLFRDKGFVGIRKSDISAPINSVIESNYDSLCHAALAALLAALKRRDGKLKVNDE